MDDLREKVARAIAFSGRPRNDVSEDASEFWAYTCEVNKARYFKMADAAIAAMPAPMSVPEAARVLLDLLQTPSNKAPLDTKTIDDCWDWTFRETGFSAVHGFLRALASPEGE